MNFVVSKMTGEPAGLYFDPQTPLGDYVKFLSSNPLSFPLDYTACLSVFVTGTTEFLELKRVQEELQVDNRYGKARVYLTKINGIRDQRCLVKMTMDGRNMMILVRLQKSLSGGHSLISFESGQKTTVRCMYTFINKS